MVLLDAHRIPIRNEIEPHAVLEECLESGEHQGESLRGVRCLFHELVPGAGEAGFP